MEMFLVSNNAPQGVNTRVDTTQFGYQGFFWNGNIVATFGWRKDYAKSKNFINADQNTTPHPNGVARTNFYPYVDDAEFGDFGDTQSGITNTKGLVARPLSWLSFHWNESDTFQPNIGRFDPYGVEYPGAEGEGEDYGFPNRFIRRSFDPALERIRHAGRTEPGSQYTVQPVA